MAKKSFGDSPALAFLGPKNQPNKPQEKDRNVAQEIIQPVTYQQAQQAVQKEVPDARRDYVRTQGRKGHKKPRINLAFDSDAFLNDIRKRADKEGKSITQLVNDAVAFYLDSKKGKR